MRKLLWAAAAMGALGAAATGAPAFAAVGQCFDAYGRPFGPPHNTDNPPYDLICRAYAIGGSCTHVQPGWAQANCGFGPRYPRYRVSPYTYGPGFPERPRGYYPRNPRGYIQHPEPGQPPMPNPGCGMTGQPRCPEPPGH